MRIVEPRPEQMEIIAPAGRAEHVLPWIRSRMATYLAPSQHAPQSLHERRARARPSPEPAPGAVVDLRI